MHLDWIPHYCAHPPPEKPAMLSPNFHPLQTAKECAGISLGDTYCTPEAEVSLQSSSESTDAIFTCVAWDVDSSSGPTTRSYSSPLSITCIPGSGISTLSTFLGPIDHGSLAYTGSKRPRADSPDPTMSIHSDLVTGSKSSDNHKRPRTGRPASPDPTTSKSDTLPAPSEIENAAPSDSDLDATAHHDSDSQSKKWKKIHETRRMLKEKRLRSEVKMSPYDLWVGR
jgi:hypothetical protein